MEQFISESPSKTPAMTVSVLDRYGRQIREYAAPEGFQLEKYLFYQYPGHKLDITFPNGNIKVKVFDSTNYFIETHNGVYQKNDLPAN
jgi:hypothetical protein